MAIPVYIEEVITEVKVWLVTPDSITPQGKLIDAYYTRNPPQFVEGETITLFENGKKLSGLYNLVKVYKVSKALSVYNEEVGERAHEENRRVMLDIVLKQLPRQGSRVEDN
ncbi:hypothetical protein BWI97_07060 [Siphonobacter sp. BAB-5405]|nr:hypothetical protein [Siphonobacter sp. BAB-5405]PMD97382.1 hypothetical protein BWI97_07060 [Siphonobacter sp. BAB-5405]